MLDVDSCRHCAGVSSYGQLWPYPINSRLDDTVGDDYTAKEFNTASGLRSTSLDINLHSSDNDLAAKIDLNRTRKANLVKEPIYVNSRNAVARSSLVQPCNQNPPIPDHTKPTKPTKPCKARLERTTRPHLMPSWPFEQCNTSANPDDLHRCPGIRSRTRSWNCQTAQTAHSPAQRLLSALPRSPPRETLRSSG